MGYISTYYFSKFTNELIPKYMNLTHSKTSEIW